MPAPVLDWTSTVAARPIVRSNKYDLEHAMKTERKAESLLAKHAHFRGQCIPIDFHYMNRTLIVSGNVDSYYLKQLAQEALRGLEGIDRIENRIVVVSAVKTNRDVDVRHPINFQQSNREN